MNHPSVAIVGSETLLGKEIRDVMRDSGGAYRLQFIGVVDEDAGRITQNDDEPVVITGLDAANLASADAVILAGPPESSHKAWDLLAGHRDTPVIDVSRTLEEIPSSRLQAPILGRGEAGYPAVVAHPAAVALAMFYSKLEAFALRRTLVEIFEPASERGKAGIDELHQQTMKLFAFQGLPKAVFDEQLAFNMLARFGHDSPHSIEQLEQAIERHFVSLMAGSTMSMPSMRLIQAPVFHGYSFSIWLEMEADVSNEDLATALFAEEDPPNNVNVAGENGISVGGIRPDRNHPRAHWVWMTADNLRLSAANAVQLLEQLCPV